MDGGLGMPVARCFSFLFCVFSVVIAAAGYSPSAVAQSDADVNPNEYEEDYDFSWLDPDKKIYVVQNRKYLKGRHLEVSLGAGFNLSGPYTDSTVIQGRAGYFFNEDFGLSFVGASQSNTPNDTFLELKRTSSVFPNIRDVESFYGASFVWVPFYGKYNLFNTIFYVDWAWELGVASISSRVNLNFQSAGRDAFQSTSHTGFFWGTGMKFFITRMLAARLDMLALYYSAPVVRQGVVTSETTTNDNYYLTMGLSAHF
jgi:outer membrane beta-barrel protein